MNLKEGLGVSTVSKEAELSKSMSMVQWPLGSTVSHVSGRLLAG